MGRVHDRDGKPRPSEEAPINTTPRRVDTEAIVEEKERHWSGKLKKPTQTPAVEDKGQGFQGTDPFAVDYPALVAFVRDVTYEDGSRRSPGSVVLFVQDGLFTVCLTDKGQPEQVAFQAAWTPTEALRKAEEGLRAGTLPWRASKRSQGRSR